MSLIGAGDRRAQRSTLARVALGIVAGAVLAALAPALPAGAAGTVATAVSLASSANPSVSGDAITLTAFVTVPSGIPSGTGEPSGTVTFSNGSTTLGSAPLDPRGDSVLTTTKLPEGSDTVTAAYGGDTAYAKSSGTLSETVSASVPAPTVTELGFSPAPVTKGQPELITAFVSAQGRSGSSAPAGKVVFSSGSTTLGTETLASGQASLSVSSLPEGDDIIDAAYQGSSMFAVSQSSAPLEVVGVPVSTDVQLSSLVNPAISGAGVTFDAYVSGQGGALPTGTVKFSDGTASLGTATLKDGTATLSTSSLSVGDHVITAAYAGDSGFAAGEAAITEAITSTKAPTSVSVFSSWSPAPTGSSVTFSAYVAASDGVGKPTGRVTFTATSTSGSTALGSASLASGTSTASVSTSTLAAGTYQITAVYGGDSANSASTGDAVQAVTANVLATTTDLFSSLDPSPTGQAVTFTASVISGSGPAPTGSVKFTSGSTTLATVTLKSGSASLTKSFPKVGTNEIEASYSGSSIYAASSTALSQVVGSGPVPTSFTALGFDPDPGVVGQPVTFSAELANLSGAPVDGGTVTVSTGGGTLGSAPVENGYAQLSGTFTSAGSYQIDLVYSGTSELTATEDSFLEVVQSAPLPTETELSSSIDPAVKGQAVVLSAVVQSDTDAGAPEGTVTFKDGSTTLGVETTDGDGGVSLTTTALPVGTDTITASFAGDGYGPSTASYSQTVGAAKLATVTTIYATQTQAVQGQSVTLSASVGTAGQYDQLPTGVVTFASGSVTLGSAALLYGYATISTTALPVGSDDVTVTYAGDQFFAGSDATVTETVTSKKSPLQLSFGTSTNPSVSGQPVTLEVSFPVSDATGTVSFADGSTALGTALVVTAEYVDEATLQLSSLPVGSDVLTATYSGNGFYDAGSAVLTQSVSAGALPTSTDLLAGANPVAAGQSVSFTDVVTPTAGAASPEGTVTFSDGSTKLATVPLSVSYYGSEATYTTASLSAGSHAISAGYSGNANSAPSTATADELVQPATSTDATTVFLTSASNPSVAGASVYFVAGISAASGGAGAVGNVTLTDTIGGHSMLLGSGNVSPGEENEYFYLPLTTAGANVITANFSGDTNWLASQTTLVQTVTTPHAASVLSLSSSADPSRAGQPVTFTAEVGPQESVGNGYGSYVAPTGSVTFLDGSTTLATTDLSGGQASLSTSGLAAGNATISAVYSGDANYGGSQSSLGQQVSSGALASSVTASAYPSEVKAGLPVSLEATVSGPGDAASPSGSVTFTAGPTKLGTAALSGGYALLTTSALPTGTDTVTATYSGDVNYATGSSTTQATVMTTKFASTVAPYSSGTVTVGQPSTIEGYVESTTGGTTTPTGTLSFTYGSAKLGSVSLSSGFGELSTSSLPAGTDTVGVAYSGDSSFTASTGSVDVTVSSSKLASTTTLTTSASDVMTGQPVTLTATVGGPSGSSTPTGTVTFTNGSTTLGASTLQGGMAELTVAGLAAGTGSLRASYGGDGNFTTSSGTAPITVSSSKLKSKTTLSSEQKTSSSGEAVTFVAVVAGPSGSEPPTGTVTFTYGSTVLGAVPLSPSPGGGGTATRMQPETATSSGTSQAVLTTSALPAGKDSIKASYGGNAAYGSSSGTYSQTVDTAVLSPSISLSASANPSAKGQSVTFTVTVTPPSGDSDLPSGTVAFSGKNGSTTTPLGTLALSNEGGGDAVVSISISSLAKGSNTITAAYSGDASYAAKSASLTQTVDTTLPTTTAVTATPSLTHTGQAVTVSATVSATGGGYAAGDVVFSEGSTALGSAPVSFGEASIVTSALSVGTDTVTATYEPGPYFGASSGTTSVSVSSSKLATTTSVFGSSPTTQGEVDQIEVDVAGTESGESTPTGTVKLTSGSTTLGSAPLQYGFVTFNVSTLPVGTDTVKASYSGDSDFKASSGTTEITVVEGGYWLGDSKGDVYPFGSASTFSVAGGSSAASGTIVGTAPTPDGQGYYLVSNKGKVFAYGDAIPPTTSCPAASDYVALTVNPFFEGLWLVQANGQVCALGGADTLGPSSGTTLSGTVAGMATTSDGGGLYLVTDNGSVYAYGDATSEDFGGLSSGTATNIVGMALSQYGEGYWLVSATGAIHPFGAATSFGSESGDTLPGPIVGMAPTADVQGYYLVTDTGKVYPFGDAISYGDRSSDSQTDIVNVAGVPAEA